MRRSYVVPMRWMVIYEYEVTGGALNVSSTKLSRPWSPWGTSPSRKNLHGRTGNRILKHDQPTFLLECHTVLLTVSLHVFSLFGFYNEALYSVIDLFSPILSPYSVYQYWHTFCFSSEATVGISFLFPNIAYDMGPKIFQTSNATRMIRGTLHAGDPQIRGTTI
jgi:hypothetical protein